MSVRVWAGVGVEVGVGVGGGVGGGVGVGLSTTKTRPQNGHGREHTATLKHPTRGTFSSLPPEATLAMP